MCRLSAKSLGGIVGSSRWTDRVSWPAALAHPRLPRPRPRDPQAALSQQNRSRLGPARPGILDEDAARARPRPRSRGIRDYAGRISRSVLGRLKDFCKPYDFVLAPAVRDGDFNLDEEANKPILVTRFTKASEKWSTATYINVRTSKPCRITVGESTGRGIIAVRSYRSVLNAYVNNAESKFEGPDGKQCCSWTRGVLQRAHIVAGEHRYCGKEFKRKLEQGPVDHDTEVNCKVYENGRVVASPETLRQLASFSERQISKRTGVHRDTIRLIRHGKGVKRSTYDKVISFLRENAPPGARA